MYAGWPMFRGMIHNAELALAKCDMQIAKHYAELAGGDESLRLYETINAEFEPTDELLRSVLREQLIEEHGDELDEAEIQRRVDQEVARFER